MSNKLEPVKIAKINPYLLYTEWIDGFSGTITLERLRAECPCAECQKDNLSDKKKPMFQMKTFKQGMNDLVQLKQVGNYAVEAVWGDGHDTGIYSWETLREIFEKYSLSREEIEKTEKKNEK